MGLNIREIVPRKEIELTELKGKIIAVDAFNAIYQFLSSIRQYDGTPLKDSKGNVTSHLSGLFYRNISLLTEGIKLVYVFDGLPPELKYETNKKRTENKKDAHEKYLEAKEKDDFYGMRKYSQQSISITKEIIEESKELLEALGIAVIQAPGEGEAQASYLVKNNKAYAVASQDYDCLLFGAQRIIQNLTLAKKRKTVSGYIEIKPEMIELERVLNTLQIDHEQMICLGIINGTDYNPKGIFKMGPKKALQMVQKFKQPSIIFKQFDEEQLNFDWQEIFEMFKKPDVKKISEIEFPKFDPEKIKSILQKREFSLERIENQIKKYEDFQQKKKQKGLSDFI